MNPIRIEPLETRIAPATFTVTALTDVVADDDQLTLREAIAAANDTPAADTIKFDPALAGVVTLALGQLNITETLTILGGGKITLSGNHATRIFSVNNADTVQDHPLTIGGLTFVRGNAGMTGDGGAIVSTEGLAILNCVFADNTAGGIGGAVQISTATGTVTVKNSHFSDNTSTDGTGGLHAVGMKAVTIAGSVFDGNSGDSAGGAFLGVESAAGKITVTGSIFAHNETTGSGGGLGVSGLKVSIANSQFIGNTAALHGGGLRLGEGAFALSGLKFLGNSAAEGGAISSVFGAKSITLSKSLLEGNEATGSAGGGGIYFTGSAPGFAATISATQLIGNRATAAGGDGGGIFAFDTGGKITVTGSLIAGNTATSQGGGIAVRQNTVADLVVTLTGNTISGNEAGSAAGLSLNRHGDFILTKNVIAGNRASGNSGGLDFDVDGDVTFKNNQVVGNRAGTGTGGMRFVADTGSTFTDSGNLIAFNEGGSTGGLSILSSVDVTIAKNTKITGNIGGSATNGGGVTAENAPGEVRLLGQVTGNHNRVNAAFDQTHGTIDSGPAPVPGVAANLIVTNLNDSGPGSLRDAIAQANATPAADKIKFDDALAGVVTLATQIDITEPLTIYGRGKITLSGNDATRIFSIDNPDDKDRPVTLSGLTFTKGSATRGSAVEVFQSVTILDCLFVDNDTGTGSGGAVFAELESAAVTIKGSHFAGNSGGLGGGVFASSEKALTIAHSVFAGNVSGSDGGGANLVGTTTATKIWVAGSLFTGNSTLTDGAGLATRGKLDGAKFSKAAVVSSIFAGNGSLANGGGLRLEEGGFTLTGVQVIGNTANTAGGGLFVADVSTKLLTVSKSLIAGNDAGASGGGGVYLGQNAPGFAATFTATQILGNTTTNGTGGGLLADGIAGKLTVSTSLVAGNSAKTGGGLAARGTGATSTAVMLSGNVIAGNEAETGAGLSFTDDGALALTKNAIVANHASLGGGGAVLQSIAAITLKTNSVLANRADSGVGGLFLAGPATASFTTAGDVIAFNEGTSTGGLQPGMAISGIIAKNTKITGNIGAGAIHGGGVTNDSTASVKLLATVLGNLNRTHPAQNETFGLFAP